MKRVMCLLIVMVLLSPAIAQEIETYSLNNMDPQTEYESYAFLTNKLNDDRSTAKGKEVTRVTTTNDATVVSVEYIRSGWATDYPREDSIIRDAISYEFDVEGIDRKGRDADMYIQYHIYDSDYVDDDAYIYAIEDYQYEYPLKQDLISNLDDGTVVMSVIDAEKGENVWEGFAYNSYEEDASYEEKRQGLRQAVDALVDQFLADNNSSSIR